MTLSTQLVVICALVSAPPAVPVETSNPDDLQYLKSVGIAVDVQRDTIIVSDSSPSLRDVAKRLSGMRWIRGASLLGGDSTDALEGLAGIPALERLTLHRLGVTTELFRRITVVRGLRTLVVRGCDVQGDDLDALLKLEYLTSLELNGTFDHVNYAALAEFPRLRAISLNGRGIDDGVAVAVGNSNSIDSVRLSGARVTDDGVRAMVRAGRLRSLILEAPGRVTNASISGLGELKSLESLEISFAPIDDHGLDELLRLKPPMLRHLSLANTRVSAVGVVELAESGLRLETLELSGILFDRRAVEAVARMATVKVLHLTSCGLTDESADALATMTGLMELEIIGNQISDGRIEEWKRKLPKLRIRSKRLPHHL